MNKPRKGQMWRVKRERTKSERYYNKSAGGRKTGGRTSHSLQSRNKLISLSINILAHRGCTLSAGFLSQTWLVQQSHRIAVSVNSPS